MMASTVPPDLQLYASQVGRQFRDRPDEERRAIEADLARHLHELGHKDLDQCRRELGSPESYGAQLRDSLGLPSPVPPPQVRRRTVAAGIGLALALVVASMAWFLSRPFDPPPDFRALHLTQGASWNESGTSVGVALRISVDQGGIAVIASELLNTSDRTLDVHDVRAEPIGIDRSGGVIAPEDPKYFESQPDHGHLTTSEIWAATVEMADPADIEVLEPEGGTGWRELRPFAWEPGQSLYLRFGGPVIACDSQAINFVPSPTIGGGRKIVIDYSIDGRAYSEEIGSYFIEFEACLAASP